MLEFNLTSCLWKRRAVNRAEERMRSMSTVFDCGSSPIYQYPPDVPQHIGAGTCNPDTCRICLAQKQAREDGRATVIGTMTWSGTSRHSTLKRSFLDVILGRPGKWVPD